jgi:hypothetical protein
MMLPGGAMSGIGSTFLADLTQPTPSGIAKLIAAWDDLQFETRVEIWARMAEADLPSFLMERLRRKALGDSNPYIRYLAGRGVHLDTDNADDREIKARIESDGDPLVRYALLEDWLPLGVDTDCFFSLPQAARLALVRAERGGRGKVIAGLISHAVEHQLKAGLVSEIELLEILIDYLGSPQFHEYYRSEHNHRDREGYRERDMEALWKLVPTLPGALWYPLVQHLPEGEGGIDKDVLVKLTGPANRNTVVSV